MESTLTQRIFVLITLIISIVLQSFMISADSTELHELTVDHGSQEAHHVHMGYVTSFTTFDVDADHKQDCHHNGHSSSAQFSWEFNHNHASTNQFDNINSFSIKDFALKDIVENRLRPPIA